MVEKDQLSEAGLAFDEDVNNVYRDQMGASRTSQVSAMNRSGMSNAKAPTPVAATKNNTTAMKSSVMKQPESMQEKPKISQAVPKPKISLLNNRNKQDHIRTLLAGVDKPKD